MLKLRPMSLALSLGLVLLTGCEESVVEALVIPSASISSASYPSGLTGLKSSNSATANITFSHAHSTSLVAATGTSAAPPSGLTVTTSGTAACSSIATSSVSTSGATLTVGGCTGNGSVTVKVSADTITSESGRKNSSSSGLTLLVDNTAPTATMAVSNNYSQTTDGDNTVVVTFSELVQDVPSNAFNFTGCTTPPAVSVAMSVNGSNQSVATATLTGGTCANTNTVNVSLTIAQVEDMSDNVMTTSVTAVNYIIDSVNPVVHFAVNYTSGSDAGSGATIDVTYYHAHTVAVTSDITGATTASSISGMTISPTGGSVCDMDVNVATPATNGFTILLTNCTPPSGGGVINFQVNTGAVVSVSGLQNSADATTVQMP